MTGTHERAALYPGSFDPPTNGHLWVIDKVADQFDKGHVAIGINPEKSGRFSVAQRQEMLQEITSPYPNIDVSTFAGMFQADYAQMMGARYVIRGTRNQADFAYESDNRHINTTLNPQLETVVFIPPKELLQVSSSMVTGFLGLEGGEEEVSKLVPGEVMKRLETLQAERDKAYLGRKFTELCARLGAKERVGEVFEDLYARWTEADRVYHAVPHWKMCISELGLVRDDIEDPDATEFALDFHDAIHNEHRADPAVRGDDEAESANLAEDVIVKKLLLPHSFADRVTSRILATKHKGLVEGEDEKYTADIDLAILGRSERLYDIYEDKIRREYDWVPAEAFRTGRGRVLKSFTARDAIYQTDSFRKRYEPSARRNLDRAIIRLAA